MLVEKLVQRIRDLLLKNKRLDEITANVKAENQIQYESNNKKLNAYKEMISEQERQVRDIDILLQRIIIKISDTQMKYGDTTMTKSLHYTAEINILERARLSIEAIFAQINLAASLINEWTMDQIEQLPHHFENRDKLLELQHQIICKKDLEIEKEGTLKTAQIKSKNVLTENYSKPAILTVPHSPESKEKKLLQEILNKVTDLRNQTETMTAESAFN